MSSQEKSVCRSKILKMVELESFKLWTRPTTSQISPGNALAFVVTYFEVKCPPAIDDRDQDFENRFKFVFVESDSWNVFFKRYCINEDVE